MSVSSGSDVTIPIQDSPPPPPSPYGNRNPGAGNSNRGTSETPEPKGDIGGATGVDNNAYQPTEIQTNGHKSLNQPSSSPGKKTHTEIPMSNHPDSSGVNEAVNGELINMNVLDTIPQKPQPEYGPFENFDEYFISVNQHKKFLRRGEKLYVTKDKRKTTKWKKYICWLIGAFILASIVTVAILAAVGLIPPSSSPTTLSMVEMTTFKDLSATSEQQQSSSTPPDESTEKQSSSTPPDEPTEKQPPVFDNYVPSGAEIQLTLDNGEFDDALSDKTSEKFIELATDLEQKIKMILVDDGKLENAFVRITGFSHGSIVANVRIGWVDHNQTLRDVQRFVSTLRKIGDYDIRPGTTSYPLYNLCNVNMNDCSHYCTFDYETLDFLCTCPDHLLLSENKKICEEISSPSPSPPPSSSQNVTDSETVPDLEVPTIMPPDVPEETTDHVIPAVPEPSVGPMNETEVTSTSTTTVTPELEHTNVTSSEHSNITEPNEIPVHPAPTEISLNVSESTSGIAVILPEESGESTNMPDIDYNVEVNPELTPDHVTPENNTTEKFAQIISSEATILTEERSVNSTSPVMTIEEVIHPLTLLNDSVSTTTIIPPPIIEIVQTTTPTPVDDQPNQSDVETVTVINDLASTTTTTTIVIPLLVEVIESNTTSTENDSLPSLEEEAETVFQNGSSETNRTSRLILESHARPEVLEAQETPILFSEEEHQQDTSTADEVSAEQQHEHVVPNPTVENKTVEIVVVVPTVSPDNQIVATTSTNLLIFHEPSLDNHTIEISAQFADGSSDPGTVVLAAPEEEREREALSPVTPDVITIEVSTTPPKPEISENNTETEIPAELLPQTITILMSNTSETEPEIDTVHMTEQNQTVLIPSVEEVEHIVPSDEVEISSTSFPPRPHITSDEFMAYSDANMSLVNAKLNLKKNESALISMVEQPTSSSIEAGSYEASGSADESEVVSSGSHSLEENIPAVAISHENEHREIEEVTTIQPISLVNDTGVNDWTENVTEDLVNAEHISLSEETISAPVTENSGSREYEHEAVFVNDTEAAITATTLKPATELPEPNPIEQSKPLESEENFKLDGAGVKAPTIVPVSEEIPASHEILETTPIPSAGKDYPIFATTIPILPNLSEIEKEKADKIPELSTSTNSPTTTTPIAADTLELNGFASTNNSTAETTATTTTSTPASVDNENDENELQ